MELRSTLPSFRQIAPESLLLQDSSHCLSHSRSIESGICVVFIQGIVIERMIKIIVVIDVENQK